MSAENKGVSFSSKGIPEEMRESMGSTAFSCAVELHDLIRRSGATASQAGFTLGVAGSMFMTSLMDERKGGFDKTIPGAFLSGVSDGIESPVACDIGHINTVLDDSTTVDLGAGKMVDAMDAPPVDISALSAKQRDIVGCAAGVMAMEDFNGTIKVGGLKPQEVAFMYGLAARILIDVVMRTGFSQGERYESLVTKMLSGFAQGISQPVEVSVATLDVAGAHRSTVH